MSFHSFFDLISLTGSIPKATAERLPRKEIFNEILVPMVSANRAGVDIIDVSSLCTQWREIADVEERQPCTGVSWAEHTWSSVHSPCSLYLKCILTVTSLGCVLTCSWERLMEKKKWFLNQKSCFDLTKILSGKRLGEPYLHCCIFFPLSKESILGKLLISTIYHLYQVCAHEAPFTGGLMLVELRGIPLVENALTSKYSWLV